MGREKNATQKLNKVAKHNESAEEMDSTVAYRLFPAPRLDLYGLSTSEPALGTRSAPLLCAIFFPTGGN